MIHREPQPSIGPATTGDPSAALLALLVEINREVAGALDLRTALQRLVFAAMQHVGGERGSIIVLDDTGEPLDATIVYGKSLHENTSRQLKETIDRGLAGWVVRHRKAALVPNTSMDERWLRRSDDASDQSGAKSALCVPLLARERLVGVLTIVHSLPNAFGPEHLELAKAIADQASIAVLNARLYTESSRRARVMTALADGAAAFSGSLDVHEVWQRVVNQVIQALQVETAAIGLLDGPEQSIVFRAAGGQRAGNIVDRRVTGGKGLAGQVIRDGRGIVIADTTLDRRFTDADRFAGIEARAIALAPIQAQGTIIGVLEAINPVARAFDSDALTVMMGIGGLAGATIRNAQLFEQLQNAHRRYRELFEASIDPIFITDWKGKIVEANRQAAALSGYTQDALRRMSIDQLHQVNWEHLGMEFEKLGEGRVETYESVLHNADSGKVPIEVHARRVEFEAADSIQWTVQDLTERKELDSLRDDLASMIYHDLRSPLGNITGSLSMLSGLTGENENARSMLEVATRSTDRIQRLVDSLLDLNRLESGHPLTSQRSVEPKQLVQNAVRDVTPAAASRSGAIRVQVADGLPRLWVDPDMMRRVLINLLENALKFSSAETDVEIGARRQDSCVEFWVQDHGPGIPVSERKRIFEKFRRLKDTVNRSRGLGIGLAFCEIAVRAHGGTIRVEGDEGKGSRFVIALPAEEAHI
jgi:NtrC-family two-component system sensor histidine kinase KinB